MNRMENMALSPQERVHVEQGGQLLVVEELAGPRWQVLSVTQRGHEVLPATPTAVAHELHRDAQRAAAAAAYALGNKALLRPSHYSYEVEFHMLDAGMGWRLRMQEDSRDVEERLYHLPGNADDDEEAFYGTHEMALNEGERWVASRGRNSSAARPVAVS